MSKKMMIRLTVLIGIALCVRVFAAPPTSAPATPPALRSAVTAYDTSVSQATRVYKDSLISAKKKLITEIEKQLADAMKRGNLEEANTLNAMKKKLEDEIKTLQADSTKATVYQLKSTESGWQDMMEVKQGVKYQIRISGKVNYDTKGRGGQWFDANGNRGVFGTITARCGEGGKSFVVGVETTFTADSSGVLQLSIQDSNFQDNSGNFMVGIKVLEDPSTLP